MKIKLKTTLAGPNGTWPGGSVIEKPPGEAKALIEGGYATPHKPAIETAAGTDAETAIVETEGGKSKAKTKRKTKKQKS